MYELWFNLPKSSLHGVKVQAMKFHHKNTLRKNIVTVSFVNSTPRSMTNESRIRGSTIALVGCRSLVVFSG